MRFLFGGSCFLCRGRAGDLVCGDCDAELPRLDFPLCPRCALASPAGAVCGRCLSTAPHYDATRAALAYDFPAGATLNEVARTLKAAGAVHVVNWVVARTL